jgi:hypothetical protein
LLLLLPRLALALDAAVAVAVAAVQSYRSRRCCRRRLGGGEEERKVLDLEGRGRKEGGGMRG